MTQTSAPEYLLNTPSQDKWKKVGLKRRAGILVPLFSVYSKESTGVGDFADLKLLADWVHLTGNSILQLLPMNEMGPLFCPYDSLSSFALEPAYISLKGLAQEPADLKKRFPAGKTYVNYSVKEEKVRFLREVYLREKDRPFGFKRFQEENTYWLLDFALFKVLKEEQEGRPWYEWPQALKTRDAAALEAFKKEHVLEITFQIWLQWVAYRQFKEARAHANAKQVLFKGDLPILVSRDSADAWQHQEFFKMELAAGAPPDMYCAKGQRWGMPTYYWEKIAADGYRYIKEKLKAAQEFYDILRIDHVVGLFRIWSIPHQEPQENIGLNGFFDPRDESVWAGQGRNILEVILENTRMLLCAEDLGIIPKVCTDTLKEFGIPGNDVQGWVKDWHNRHDFLEPSEYRDLSVAMLSTHDTTNWPAWWENEAGTVDEDLFIRKCSDHRKINFSIVRDRLFDSSCSCHGRLRWRQEVDSVDKLAAILGKRREEVKDFIDLYENTYREKEKLWQHLKLVGSIREKSSAAITRRALQITLDSNAVFCINTLMDWLYTGNIFKGDPYPNRINTPGTISDKNWSLTLPLSLESLLKHKINKDIRKMIESSGRI